MSARADAEFLVEGTLALPTRGFAVYGQVQRGTIAVGQRVADLAGLSAPVAAVESVLRSASTGAAAVALVFRPRSAAELTGWQALPLAGRVLVLKACACRSSAGAPAR